jgi:hypothetical protein
MAKKTKENSLDLSMPTLYGIFKSNRSGDALWGKNQFNSSFPASLACWMRDNKINPVYLETLKIDDVIKVEANERLSWNDIFQSNNPNSELTFRFEVPYEPYGIYTHNNIERLENIDLVIMEDGQYRRPLEVKLTVLPDSSTCDSAESNWGSELVVRPASTSYAALGIFHSIPEDERGKAREIIEPTALKVRDWATHTAIIRNKTEILDTLDVLLGTFLDHQQPFLMQPIWKTNGKSPELAENAFDIFVWSDYSLCRTFIDRARAESKSEKVSRYMRSCARLLRCLNDLATTKKVLIKRIYREMALDNQTDKEFALNGHVTSKYMACERLKTPKISKNVLTEIILNGGENKLSPERRFDATIFFTAKHLFETKIMTSDS